MRIPEFYSRFACRNDRSVLFEALRRLSRLNDLKFLDQDALAWREWPPMDDPSGSMYATAARI